MSESYISIRIEPVNAVKYSGHLAEARRHKVPSYVDKDMVKNNVHTTPEISADDLRTHIENLRERSGQQKLRKDARLAFSGIITFSHEAQPIFDALPKKRQMELYQEISEEIAKRLETTVLSMSLHADESAPHAHFMLSAYNKNGKALRLNPKDTSELQDVAGQVLERNGIEITRGKSIGQRIKEAEATGTVPNVTHRTVAQLHATMATDLKKANKKLKTFVDFSVIKKINPMNFLERYGYIKNKKESSNVSAKYENGQDIIIVKQAKSGDFIYFNATDDRDCGTIIDFCKNRNIDIKQAFANKTIAPISSYLQKKEQENGTMTDLTNEFSALAPYDLPYLIKARGIEPALIRQFGVKKDKHGNACFVHKNAGITTGWEVKNEKFTGFSANGHRNLGICRLGDRIENIIICESFIDAMSYAQLYNSTNSVFVSTGGTLTEKQLEQIKALTSAYSNATVVIATDADEAGDAYETKIAAMAPAAERHRPLYGKDWNDELRDRHSRARSAAQRP